MTAKAKRWFTEILQASFRYFALVFGAGFVLGVIRTVAVVPRLGIRMAELLEIPIMIAISVFAARSVVRRYGTANSRFRLCALGLMALLFMMGAEIGLGILMGRSPSAVIRERDPVSGPAYFMALGVFAAMPLLVASSARRGGRRR